MPLSIETGGDLAFTTAHLDPVNADIILPSSLARMDLVAFFELQ